MSTWNSIQQVLSDKKKIDQIIEPYKGVCHILNFFKAIVRSNIFFSDYDYIKKKGQFSKDFN